MVHVFRVGEGGSRVRDDDNDNNSNHSRMTHRHPSSVRPKNLAWEVTSDSLAPNVCNLVHPPPTLSHWLVLKLSVVFVPPPPHDPGLP